jgi:uncharacterized protein (TIGR02598 family)
MSFFLSMERRQNRFCDLSSPRAFSLVEVVLALGISTFAILVIVALLPMGVRLTKDSLEETGALDVLSEVIADRQATPLTNSSTLYQLPALANSTTPVTNYFGITLTNTVTMTLSQARYRVDYIVSPPAQALDPYQVYLKVSWPAAAANTTNTGSVETIATFPQP